MTARTSTSRRRFITIAAAAAAAVAAGLRPASAAGDMLKWRGVAMGAEATILLPEMPRRRAEALIVRCVDELRRLEAEFSLYQTDSAISRLNASGLLKPPSLDFHRLLQDCGRFHRMTDGAFDPTVQPLWRLYVEHFTRQDGEDPAPRDIAKARALVGFGDIAVSPERIALSRPGMAITLNGVAQGYITDRVADLLRAAGLDKVLIDLGEIRVLGRHPDGRPWRVGRPSPGGETEFVALEDTAIATSSGRATPFEPTGRFHHLFDPASGESVQGVESVSVVAPTATLADALSTALSVMPVEAWRPVLARFPQAHAAAILDDGSEVAVPADAQG